MSKRRTNKTLIAFGAFWRNDCHDGLGFLVMARPTLSVYSQKSCIDRMVQEMEKGNFDTDALFTKLKEVARHKPVSDEDTMDYCIAAIYYLTKKGLIPQDEYNGTTEMHLE